MHQTLQISSDNQDKRHSQNEAEKVQNNPLRKLKIWSVAVIIFIALMFAGFNYLQKNISFEMPVSEISTAMFQQKKQAQKKTFPLAQIEKKIDLYQQKNGAKIFEWRRKKIHQAVQNKKLTAYELNQLIKQISNKKY